MDNLRLPELVERLGAVLRAGSRRRAAALGLQPVHVQVLEYVARCNRFSNTPAALTAYLQATKGTVSQSLKLLEGRGLVLRQTDADDRRVLRLSLTAAGRAALGQLSNEPSVAAAIAGIDSAGLATTETVLEQCLLGLQRDSGFDGFGVCGSCRHLQRGQPAEFRCGLTSQPLQLEETRQLCVEHRWPEADGGS